MHVVKSVGVLSCAKVVGLLYACMGLVFIPFFLLMALTVPLTSQNNFAFPLTGAIALVLCVISPVFYGILGFIFGAIAALVYNVAAKWMGGLELDLEPRSSGVSAPYPLIPPPTQNI